MKVYEHVSFSITYKHIDQVLPKFDTHTISWITNGIQFIHINIYMSSPVIFVKVLFNIMYLVNSYDQERV